MRYLGRPFSFGADRKGVLGGSDFFGIALLAQLPEKLFLAEGIGALSDAGLLQIPIAALAKEREELFVPGRPDPILLPARSQGLFLVQRIRDEAHRFAVTYHQQLRGKRAVRSVLDEIQGVGPAKKRALLRKFGSVKGMRDATEADLAGVAGVGPALAARIKQAID